MIYEIKVQPISPRIQHQATQYDMFDSEYFISSDTDVYGFFYLGQLFFGFLFLLFFPIHFAFYDHFDWGNYSKMYLSLEVVTSVVFFSDVLFTLRTVIQEGNTIIKTQEAIFHRYLRSWFVIDILSVFPFDSLFSFSSARTFENSYRLLLIVKFLHIYKCFQNWERCKFRKTLKVGTSSFWRIGRYLVVQMYIIHFTTCLLLFIASQEELIGIHSWREHARYNKQTMGNQYTHGFYFLVVTITTTGYGDTVPITALEKWIFIFIMIFSSYGLAYLFANMASIFTSHDYMRTQFDNYKNSVMFFLKSQNIDKDMIERVHNYLVHSFETSQVFPLNSGDAEMLSSISRPMRSKIQFDLHRKIIGKVVILQNKPADFIEGVLSLLKTELYAPDDYIITQGEIGDKLYFIKNGLAGVFLQSEKDSFDEKLDPENNPKTEMYIGELTEGCVFGELALFFHMKRSASVKALTYLEVYSLDKESLFNLLSTYPGMERSFREWSIQSKYKLKGKFLTKAFRSFPNILPKINKWMNKAKSALKKRRTNVLKKLRGSVLVPHSLSIK
jgi:CRP-like cAMP-binding protein